MVMMRTAWTVAMAMLVSLGVAHAGQESIAVPPASPVQGGAALKGKIMTAVGAVKAVTADSLAVNGRHHENHSAASTGNDRGRARVTHRRRQGHSG